MPPAGAADGVEDLKLYSWTLGSPYILQLLSPLPVEETLEAKVVLFLPVFEKEEHILFNIERKEKKLSSCDEWKR